jgi:HSP20 family molecular chaperone IbpA
MPDWREEEQYDRERRREHGFGDRGWGGGRTQDEPPPRDRQRDLPEQVRDVSDGGQWQERFVRQNADKYGQSGGRPIEQRGPSGSRAGWDHREPGGIGSAHEISPRGAYGIRETDPWNNRSGSFAGRGPKNWRRSDERITEDINQRLTDHPEIDATDLDVQVKEGEVTLTGTVDERRAKRLAEEIAESVAGVRDVQNQIKVMAVNR